MTVYLLLVHPSWLVSWEMTTITILLLVMKPMMTTTTILLLVMTTVAMTTLTTTTITMTTTMTTMTGKKFRCPKICIGQYVQGLVGGTNDTETERSIDSLYLGRSDNGSGHKVFKLDTKAVALVNRVVVIPTPASVTDRVNEMGTAEQQPEGILFSNRD